MAFTWKEATILIGGFDASGQARSFDTPAETTERDSTTFASKGFAEQVMGVTRGKFNVGGLQDLDAAALGAYLDRGVGTQYACSVATPGDTAGDVAWVMRGKVTRYGPVVGGTIDMEGAFDLALSSDTVFGRGVLLHPVTETDTADDGAAVALAGPDATQRLYVALHVTATTGGGTWTVLVESDSADTFGSPTTRVTFDTFTAQGWQLKSVAGDFSSETHLRASWSVTGGTDPTATFALTAFVA